MIKTIFRLSIRGRWRYMAVCIVVLLQMISAEPLYASDFSPKTDEISLSLKRVPLSTVFKEIEKITGYLFVYNENTIDAKQLLSISSNRESLESVLNKISKIAGLQFRFEQQNIIVLQQPKSQSHNGDKVREINGVVVDGSDTPVIGAHIQVIGDSSIVAVTDLDGKFSLKVPEHSTLLINSLSYMRQEIEVGDQSQFYIRLREDAKMLDDVVVVGYSTQKKATLVGSVAAIKSDVLIQSPAANITNSLNGRLPGLIAMQRQGEPGSDAADLYIRGKSTLEGAAATPLCIVDGVERDFSQIDPNEVESISILKDASATAVYGVRGANGVIIVTTKRGDEGRAKVSFSAQVGFQNPTRKPVWRDAILQSQLTQEAYYNDHKNADGSGQFFYSEEQLAAIRRVVEGNGTELEKLQYPNNNWFDELTRSNAPQQQYNLNVRGGTKVVKYFISLGYLNQGSYFKDLSEYYIGTKNYDSNYKFDRYNFRSNVDIQINKNFTATFNLAGRIEQINTPPVETQAIYSYLYGMGSLSSPIRYPDIDGNGTEGWAAVLSNGDNPVAMLTQNGYYNTKKSTVESSIILRHKLDFITKGLSVRANVSFDSQFNNQARYWEGYATYQPLWNFEPLTFQQKNLATALAFSGESYWNTNKLYQEYGLDYSRDFGVHSVTGLFLYNQQEYRNGANTPYCYQGLVGRLTYAYKGKYLGEINIGYNGSENFARKKRFGFFPAFSLGWVVSEEPFMKDVNFVSSFKIRGSYGEVGNDKLYISGQEQRFLYYSDYTRVNESWGVNYGSRFGENYVWWGGIHEGRIGNDDVTWERARKSNIGIDASFFNSSLSFTGDIFQEYRSNILISQETTVPNIVGATLPAVNKGKTYNSGYEMELTYRNKIGQVGYWVKGNYTFARNKILSIDEPTSAIAPWQRQEGRPIGQRFLYQCIGLFQSEEEIAESPSQSVIGTPGVGDRKYLDYNQDGVIDAFDAFAACYTDIPEISYGVSLGLNWKGFDFSILFQGVAHVTVDFWKGQIADLEGRWSPFKTAEENAGATWPTLHSDEGSGGSKNNSVSCFGVTANVYDGSYLKLKNAEIGYTFPQRWLKPLRISSVRVFANGTNLAILKDHLKYLDPETAAGAATMYPQMRVISFGLNVNF